MIFYLDKMQPKGSIVVECGNALLKNGYKLKILNTINFKKSMHYNPFAYVHSEKDILKLVTTLMTNTKGEGSGGDPFWEKSERLLLTALIAYLHYEAPVEEQNFATLLEMLNTMQVLEDDEEYQNPVDLLFEELAKKKPNSFAGRQYKLYKLAAGKTAKSILISCGARLAPFDIAELRDLMAYDEMELDLLGDRRTALFVIISDTDDTFNFVVSIMYTQLFNLLCDRADDQCGGQLKYHVRLLLDEFANIGLIPKFDKLIATIRSREISASIILQSQSQLKTIYKDAAETIIGNCDTMLFLGGKESSTLKEISETLGKETIDLYNTSDTRGQSPSFGTTYQKTGKELMSRDELSVMDGSKCILQLRGVRPFLSDKFDITKHKRYKELSDFDKKNAFDVERYIICTIEEVMDSIHCARQKAVKLLDELEQEFQLIERRRQGLGKPNLLYVKDLYAGLSQSNYWKYENHTSGGMKTELPGVPKSNGSNTEKINKTDNSETDLIYPAELQEEEQYRRYFKEALELEILEQGYPADKAVLYEILELLVETVTSRKKFLRICGEEKPKEVVKSRLMKLDSSHIQYILECLKENSTQIRNIKQYLLATLYNAPVTVDSYYSAQVRREFGWGGRVDKN